MSWVGTDGDKSGGVRVITHFYVAEYTVFLLSIYDKSDQENIVIHHSVLKE